MDSGSIAQGGFSISGRAVRSLHENSDANSAAFAGLQAMMDDDEIREIMGDDAYKSFQSSLSLQLDLALDAKILSDSITAPGFMARGGIAAASMALQSSMRVSTPSFTVAANKFDYFFGKVVTGDIHNIQRSAQNLKDLTTLGINTPKQLMKVFDNAFNNGKIVSNRITQYGYSVKKSIDIGNKGRLNVTFQYDTGIATPKVTTLIPQIF